MPFQARTLALAVFVAATHLHAQPAPPAAVAGALPSFVVDDDYLMFGDAQVAPSSVFASSGRTFLQLASIRGSLPSVFAVTPTGYVPIKPTFDPPYLVFEGLEQEFVLMYPGRKFVVIRHGTAPGAPPQDLPQVLFSQSRDAMKFASDEILGKARAASTQLQRERAQLGRDQQAIQGLLKQAEATKAETTDLQAKTAEAITATRRSVESTLKEFERDQAAAAGRLAALEQKVTQAQSAVQQVAARTAESERTRSETERAAIQELLRKAEQVRGEATDLKLRAMDEAATTRRTLEGAVREYQQERAASSRRFAALEEKVAAAERSAQQAAAKAAEAERARSAGERQMAQDLLAKAETARAQAADMQAMVKKDFEQERMASAQKLAALEAKVADAESAARSSQARTQAEQSTAQKERDALDEKRRNKEAEASGQQAKALKELTEARAETAQRLAELEERVSAAEKSGRPPPAATPRPATAEPTSPPPARWAIYRSDVTMKQAAERWARDAGAKFRWALQDDIDVGGEASTEAASFADALGQLAASLRGKGYRAFVKEVEGFLVLTEKP